MSPIQLQIIYALQFLFTPFGMLAISSFVLLLMLALVFPQLKWFVLSLMLFASTLTLHTDELSPTLMFPLEQMRSQARAATVALMTILVIALLVLPRGWRRKYFVPGLAFFLFFQIVLSLNIAVRNDFSRGAAGMLMNMYAFFLFGIAIPHALQSWDNLTSYVRGLAGFGVVFAALNVIQLLVKPSVVLVSRFMGTTSNAQMVGQVCSMTLLPVCYILIRSGKSRLERPIMAATAALLIIMLTWSGSRTGAIMAIVGLALLFRSRLSRLAVAGIVITLFALLAAKVIFPEKQIISAHLFDTTNSRADVWGNLLHQFLVSPLAGGMHREEAGYGESSYLSVASNLGLIGLIPFLVALALIAWSLNRLRRIRPILGDRLIADLVIAGLVQCAVGAIFEDYLLGILSASLMMGVAYLPIMAYLLESVQTVEEPQEIGAVESPYATELPAGAW